MEGLIHNENLPWDFVERYPSGLNGEHWPMMCLSKNPNLPWYFVQFHPEGLNGEPWQIKGISTITWKVDYFIKKLD